MTNQISLTVTCSLARLAATGLVLFCSAALSADRPPAEPDPLALEADPAQPGKPGRAAGSTKLFLEGAVGRATQRYGLGDRTVSRATADLRHAQSFTTSIQATVSARVDATQPEDMRIGGAVFSLREAYGGWQSTDAGQLLEVGRINLREGPAFGYNPTDYFRGNALRTVTSANPATQRENRLGTVMLRGQALWPTTSLAVAYAPKLDDRPSEEGWNVDLGATNDRKRALVTVNQRWTEKVNTQLSFFRQAGLKWQMGLSGSTLLTDALVAHAEWSTGGSSRFGDASVKQRPRAATGLTYTTASHLSVTTEWHYNGSAVDRGAYKALRAQTPQALPSYYLQNLVLQNSASRQAWFIYVTQRDLGMKNLDLTALTKLNRADNSRLAWLELRYRMDSVDLSLQWQHTRGEAGSEFGSVPFRNSAGAVVTAYF